MRLCPEGTLARPLVYSTPIIQYSLHSVKLYCETVSITSYSFAGIRWQKRKIAAPRWRFKRLFQIIIVQAWPSNAAAPERAWKRPLVYSTPIIHHLSRQVKSICLSHIHWICLRHVCKISVPTDWIVLILLTAGLFLVAFPVYVDRKGK